MARSALKSLPTALTGGRHIHRLGHGVQLFGDLAAAAFDRHGRTLLRGLLVAAFRKESVVPRLFGCHVEVPATGEYLPRRHRPYTFARFEPGDHRIEDVLAATHCQASMLKSSMAAKVPHIR